MSDINFETNRLILRKWKETDRAPFAAMNSDPIVMEYFPSLSTRDQSDRSVDLISEKIDKDGFGFWAIELKDNGEFIGFLGLNMFDRDLPFCPCVEIGWRLAYAYWGKGLATEGAKKCLEIGFNYFNLDEIYSFTALNNQRSRNVMSNIGMKNTEENFNHPQVPMESGLQEHCLYKLSKTDWSINGN